MPSSSHSDEEPAQLAIVEQELQRSATLSAARSVEFNSLREDVSSARTANDQVVKKLQASLQRSEVEALASRAEASQLREAKNLASEQLEVAVVQRETAVRQREAAAAAVGVTLRCEKGNWYTQAHFQGVTPQTPTYMKSM